MVFRFADKCETYISNPINYSPVTCYKFLHFLLRILALGEYGTDDIEYLKMCSIAVLFR